MIVACTDTSVYNGLFKNYFQLVYTCSYDQSVPVSLLSVGKRETLAENREEG